MKHYPHRAFQRPAPQRPAPQRLAPRRLAALAATLVAGLAGGALPASPASAAVSTTASGYVTRQGTQLEVGGQPWNFAGYNLSCQQPFQMTTAQLEYYFQDIEDNSGANVVRMWWFQSDLGSGSDPWAPFENIVTAAQATGIRIIPTLTNQWNTCDEPDPATSEKTMAWYQSGYTEPEGGYSLSFQAFATEMAAHFAGSPTIAFWQLVNEAEAPAETSGGGLACQEKPAADAMRSFADTMATDLHQADPNHLVNLGTQGMNECGTQGSDYGYVQAGAVDLCEVHDYTNPTDTLDPTIASDISQCHALGKPIFVGEAGIPANVQPDGSSGSAPITTATLGQRATFFKAKIDADDAAGMVGYVIWFKSPFYTPQLNSLDIADGDPTEAVLPDALTIQAPAPGSGSEGGDPPASVPQVPFPLEAPLAGLAVLGAGVALQRRRRPLR